MKPVVNIKVCGRSYSVEATFDFYSRIEEATGVGLIRLLIHKQDIKMEQIRQILCLFVKDVDDNDLKEFIMKNFTYVTNKIIDLLEIGFTNPNPRVKKMNEPHQDGNEEKKN